MRPERWPSAWPGRTPGRTWPPPRKTPLAWARVASGPHVSPHTSDPFCPHEEGEKDRPLGRPGAEGLPRAKHVAASGQLSGWALWGPGSVPAHGRRRPGPALPTAPCPCRPPVWRPGGWMTSGPGRRLGPSEPPRSARRGCRSSSVPGATRKETRLQAPPACPQGWRARREEARGRGEEEACRPPPTACSALPCGSHRAHKDPQVRPSSPSREESQPGGRAVTAAAPRGRRGLLSACGDPRPPTPWPRAQSHGLSPLTAHLTTGHLTSLGLTRPLRGGD